MRQPRWVSTSSPATISEMALIPSLVMTRVLGVKQAPPPPPLPVPPPPPAVVIFPVVRASGARVVFNLAIEGDGSDEEQCYTLANGRIAHNVLKL